jgi:hypothetical protein
VRNQKDPVALKFRLGNIASERNPTRAPWGYYCSDDHVFGAGLFLWFQTKEGMLQFLAEHEGADSEQHEQDTLRTGMRKIANQMVTGRLGFEKGTDRFNELLKGHLHIEWVGHFDDLLSGNKNFARKLRAEFCPPEAASSVHSIPNEQIPEFIELLRNYGH